MLKYAELQTCRRGYLLKYFGEETAQQCNGCDNCLAPSEKPAAIREYLPRIASKDRTVATPVSDYHKPLFEQLRVLRKSIADQKHVPSFVIFGDVSLREMSFYLPQNKESFSRITGVGNMKLAEYGEAFLSVIQAYAKSRGNLPEQALPMRKPLRVAEKPGVTHQLSKQLFEKRLSLRDIARTRNLKEDTIVNHLEKLIESGEKINIDYLQLPAERFEKIKNAFTKSGNLLRLSPVKKMLAEDFSYFEIRLARIFLRKMQVLR